MPTESSLLINVNEILTFFDEKPDWADRHSAAIVAMIFEDFAAATLEHCLRCNRATNVTIRPESVVPGGQRGPRLDRWIEADLADGQTIIWQSEIKSRSSQSMGYKPIKVNATESEFRERENDNWEKMWDSKKGTLKEATWAKVLVPMKLPQCADDREHLPLLICWQPVGPEDRSNREDQVDGGHLFKVTKVSYDFPFTAPEYCKSDPKFTELWVFSISSYLRSIRNKAPRLLEFQMPNASKKMRALLRVAPVSSKSVSPQM